MSTLGKRLKQLREEQKLSQAKLASQLNAHHSIIGRYERDEVNPTIDVVKKLAKALSTSVAYLVGEVTDNNTFKNAAVINRFNDLFSLPSKDQEYILYTIDGLLRDAKTRQAYT